jgi:hypothetical protein
MQVDLRHSLQVPLQLASKPILRAATGALGVAKDIVIVTEGVLAWVSGVTLRGVPDVYAADVAPDPFADSWDEVVRAPRNPGGSLDVSSHTRPAA